MWKWLLALASLFVSVIVLGAVLDRIGVWDASEAALGRMARIPALAPHVEAYRLGLVERGELADARRELARQEQLLAERAAELSFREARLRSEREELALERERLVRLHEDIVAREQRRQAEEARLAGLDRLRELYEAMPPAQAAAILLLLDDPTMIRILATMETRQAAAIVALLPAERAAAISRAMSN